MSSTNQIPPVYINDVCLFLSPKGFHFPTGRLIFKILLNILKPCDLLKPLYEQVIHNGVNTGTKTLPFFNNYLIMTELMRHTQKIHIHMLIGLYLSSYQGHVNLGKKENLTSYRLWHLWQYTRHDLVILSFIFEVHKLFSACCPTGNTSQTWPTNTPSFYRL
jgi:hypothetical protein